MSAPAPACQGPAPAAGPGGVTLADVVRRFGDELRRQHGVSLEAQRVLDAVAACRTAALGGQRYDCAHCGHCHYVYHSCRNRHCPKCQQPAKARWLEARQSELLPVPYFHLVFTLPHELNGVVLAHRRLMLGHLFAAAATLSAFGQRHLHGQVGFTAVLHTWDQKLNAHFHLHVLIAAGALDAQQDRWRPARPNFLFPVHALSAVFRGKFMVLARPLLEPALIRRLYAKPWVVYAKPPFAGPGKLLDYLGRYTHRVAISDHRLLAIEGEEVVFRYRDRPAGDLLRTMRLPGVEFLRRFLLHVLPPGLVRIRHYGFLANRGKARALSRCRALLGPPPPMPAGSAFAAHAHATDLTRCPRCGAPDLVCTPLRPQHTAALRTRAPPLPAACATP